MARAECRKSSYNILICGDSRIAKLSEHLERIIDTSTFRGSKYTFEFICVPGGTIDRVVETALWRCEKSMYNQVYLFAGVCDLSRRSGSLWMPIFDDCDKLMIYLKQKAADAYTKLSNIGELVILNEIVGMDIAAYNKYRMKAPSAQATIDRVLPSYNRWVHRFLTSANPLLMAPYYAAYIYKFRRGRLSARYELATSDGLHFNVFFLERLALDIAKSAQYNRALLHGHTICEMKDDFDPDYLLDRSNDSTTSDDYPAKQGWSE